MTIAINVIVAVILIGVAWVHGARWGFSRGVGRCNEILERQLEQWESELDERLRRK